MSDSEAEDADNRVTLPQNYVGRYSKHAMHPPVSPVSLHVSRPDIRLDPWARPGSGNTKQQQRGIRLTELGPRMQLELLKIQKGFCDGDVLYHELIHKTPEEIKALERVRRERDSQKAQRRRTQEDNVRRKEQAKEEQRRADRVRAGLPAEKPPKADRVDPTKATKRPREDDNEEEGEDEDDEGGEEDELSDDDVEEEEDDDDEGDEEDEEEEEEDEDEGENEEEDDE